MASRHMNFMRRYQKTILAVMGVVCMITFVVGPYILDMVSGSGGGSDTREATAVSWKGGRVTESKLHSMRNSHVVAVNFLRDVIATAVERGGQPVVNGRPITQQDLQQGLIDPGIPSDASEFTVVRTMLLAERAREMGIHVDQEAVKKFLYELAPEVPESEWQHIANRHIPSEMPMSVGQLLDQIAYDLSAQHMRMLAQAGLLGVSPGQIWDYHNRLNRRFTIEAYPVDAQGLVSEVGGKPTEAELQALFEKGKHNDPDPSLAEAGFHQPHKVAFEYLKVDFKPFLDEAKKTITAEQIAKRYEEDIKQGHHKEAQLPLDPTKPPPPPTDPAATKPGETPTANPTDPPAKPAEGDKPAEKPTENPAAADKPAEADKPAAPPEEAASPDEEVSDEEEQPAAAAPTEVEKPAEKPVESPSADPADPKPAEANPAEPATTTPPETTPPTTTPPALPPTKFKELKEVEDEIRTALAQPIAQEKRDAAVKAAMTEISDYGRKYFRWQGVKDGQVKSAKITDPGKLNLDSLASKYGFKAGSTKLVDSHEIRDYEIGQKVMEFDMRSGRFTPLSFADIAYGNSEPAYTPQSANSMEPDSSYIYWRTAEEETKDVTLADVKDQVIQAWKRQKAFEQAKKEAQKIAEKAQSAKSLKDVVDPTKVVVTAPFSWLSTGSLAFGFGEPSLSSVPGIDYAGHEFMESVFALNPGETGVAPNQPHDKVFVVRVLSQEPTDDILKEQFLESGLSFQTMNVAQREMFRTSLEWYEGLEKEMDLEWVRPPADESGN